MIRRRTAWFRLVFGEMVPARVTDHRKHVLVVRTMRGIWGEWW